jgi:UDP-GlcNAc3NAcA epimerase
MTSLLSATPQAAGRMPAQAPLAICYGTRPQVIKASMLVQELRARWELLTVDTGQHYDYELNALLYEQLGVGRPHLYLEVGSGDHAVQTGAILTRAADVFQTHSPWAVVVIGDTNSTLGCALAAAKMRIPVVHVEAGLRATDSMMAEEINRRVVDSISSLLCAPSAAAAERLRIEHAAGAVVLTGDIARDILLQHISRAPRPGTLSGWPLDADADFVFATLHRAELTEEAERLRAVTIALGELALPVVLATHPRTRLAMERYGLIDSLPRAVHMLPPLGYLETLGCIRTATAVVTDSGGVQREAYWLGTPCVTVRRETEWAETVQARANVLVAPERAPDGLARAVGDQIRSVAEGIQWDRNAYGDGRAANKIRDAVEHLSAAEGVAGIA